MTMELDEGPGGGLRPGFVPGADMGLEWEVRAVLVGRPAHVIHVMHTRIPACRSPKPPSGVLAAPAALSKSVVSSSQAMFRHMRHPAGAGHRAQGWGPRRLFAL